MKSVSETKNPGVSPGFSDHFKKRPFSNLLQTDGLLTTSVLRDVEIQRPVWNTRGVQKSARSTRALRGTTAAFFATFVSLISHVLAGGDVPGILNIALPLALSFLVCMLLSGRQFTLARLAGMVGFSQLLFHLMFSMGAGHSAASTASGQGLHAHHGMDMPLDVTASADAATMSHVDTTMLLAHLMAGLATVLVLHRSEQMLIAAASIVDLLTWKLLWRLVTFAYQLIHPQPTPTAPREIPTYTICVYATSVIRRGPPALITV